MITLKEILDGSKDREMEIREEIKKIDELLKLLPTTNSNYDIWLNKRNDLKARLVKKESFKESVKKEAYTIIKVDGAEVPIEITPDGNEGKDMKGNRYLKLDGVWRMESVTIMQGSPTEYKVGSRVRIVGGLYSNSFGKITAMNENEITVETEVDGKKVKVLPKQIVMAEAFINVMEALKEGMSKYNQAKVVRKEGISKDTEDWIYQVYQKRATVDDIKDLLRIEKDIVMPLEGIRYIIQNYKESFKEANPISDYDDKELNDKAMDLFGKGFQFLSDAERKQVLDSFKEVVKKEIICNTCKDDAETVNGRPYCNKCQKFLDESLKEMANVNKIKLTGAWNIPKIVSKLQDLAVNYGTHFADGVIDTKGLLDRELSYRNHIELQAISALKYLAKLILFVFDPTESCGYSMQKQMSIYNEISEQFIGIPFIKILNKSDLKEWGFKEDIEGIKISAEEGENIDLLKENIEEILFNYFEEEVDYFEKD